MRLHPFSSVELLIVVGTSVSLGWLVGMLVTL